MFKQDIASAFTVVLQEHTSLIWSYFSMYFLLHFEDQEKSVASQWSRKQLWIGGRGGANVYWTGICPL